MRHDNIAIYINIIYEEYSMSIYSLFKRYQTTCNSTLIILCMVFLISCSIRTPQARYYSNFGGTEYNARAQYYSEYAPQYAEPSRKRSSSQRLQTIPSSHGMSQKRRVYNQEEQPLVMNYKKIPAHYRPYIVFGKKYYPLFDARGYVETGIASWYGPSFHGKKTSNGEIYNMHAETAAHKTLPMGTIVRVTNLENNRAMMLRINDRGPFVGDRIIDLSKTAANKLGIYRKGTGLVKVEVVQAPPPLQARHRGEYYLQVGAFSDKSKAHTIRSSIERKGLPTRLIAGSNNKVWKVQVGPMKQLVETTRTKEMLYTDFPETYIVLE